MRIFDFYRSILPFCLVVCWGTVSVLLAATTPGNSETGKGAGNGTTYRLESTRGVGNIIRVKALLKVKGRLKIKSAEKMKENDPSVQVTSKLYYDEKILDPPNKSRQERQSVRYYYLAEAQIGIDQKATSPSLSTSRRTIVHTLGEKPILFSPQGALNRAELDLLDIPGDTLSFDELLPVGEVHLGQSWSQNGHVLQRWLGLDDVGQADISSQLVSVKDDQAKVEMKGHLTGMAGGVETEMDIIAEYHFDFGKQHITRLTLDIQEKRAAGYAEPGLDVLARLQLRMIPVRSSESLDEAELAQYDLSETGNAGVIRFESQRGGFQTHHEPRWHVILENDKTTMFRLVDNGDLLGQCNVARLPNLEPGSFEALGDFQAEIRKALGDHFGEFVEAEESDLKSGLKKTRVVAGGTVGKLSIRWTYYQLTHKDGRRATCVFTSESGKEERFAGADETMISSFSFLAGTDADQNPTKADRSPTETKETAQTGSTIPRR